MEILGPATGKGTFTDVIDHLPKSKLAHKYKNGLHANAVAILPSYDPTIAEKFNTYRFKDYKEQVIDLLKRVCTVSVQTMEIVRQMAST